MDPASSITLADHAAREAFEIDVWTCRPRVESLATDLRTRRARASGDDAARLQALERRLVGGGGRGNGGGRGGAQPVRQRLNGLITAFVGSGAQTGTLAAPTAAMRTIFEEAQADLAALENEIRK